MNFMPKEKQKSLSRFLQELIALNMSNLEFLKDSTVEHRVDFLYLEELKKVQELINSFKF